MNRVCLAMVLGLLMTSAVARDDSTAAKPVLGVGDLKISQTDYPKIVSAALAGDGDAALRLANHYGFVKLDRLSEMYWLQIAAEDGNPQAMYDYAQALLQSGVSECKLRAPTADDTTRANFWAKRAADAGVPEAKRMLNHTQSN